MNLCPADECLPCILSPGRLRSISLAALLAAGLMCATAQVRADDPVADGQAEAGQKAAASIGRQIEPFTLKDWRGKEHSLADYSRSPVLVVAFLGTECPLVRLYGPRLEELAKEYEERGVAFLGVNANRQDSVTEMGAWAREHGVTFPLLKDSGNRVADAFGAERTPEVFVLDAKRVVRYRGRIDDQYGVGYVRDEPRQRDLAEAVDDLLAGRPVGRPVTETVGCHIGRIRTPQADSPVTYSREIARILQ
ncbi:MAG: thioredoxin family protein, partial [Planctomycetaceae bacterium]|nr:thioredoxin family protein [Planctomycetaceae bacterium]